ncbi:MAG: flavodoxin domain-containing protein [Patescibacteria group bacterium]
MNILVTYATNSGSTYLVAKYISEKLQEHTHQVTLLNIMDANPEDLLKYDLVFLGSNSWDFEHKEGQPHHAFMQFLDGIKDVQLSDHKYVLFGCGDKSYQYFCGALTVIEEFVKAHAGQVIAEPLKINQYFFNDTDKIHSQIDSWLSEVEQKF